MLPLKKPRLLLLSAYDAASHARWRRHLVDALPEFEWHTLTLPPRYFSWRIRGNPLSWLDEPLFEENWDGLVVTSMVDLATLRGLRPTLAQVPTLAYFHENQFFYPGQPQEQARLEPQMVNLFTALSAERVVFNSDWNRRSLIRGVTGLMARFPDRTPSDPGQGITDKSSVIPVPLEDSLFTNRRNRYVDTPLLLWNHRWEHDKGPDRLLHLLRSLRTKKFKFRLSVVGEQFRRQPESFSIIAEEFADQIEVWGYQRSAPAYKKLLAEADLVLSTSLHDFQGLAVLEAMAAGCIPWVPDRLAYPEYVPKRFRYMTYEAEPISEAQIAADGLIMLWQAMREGSVETVFPERYRTSHLVGCYRRELEELISLPAKRLSC